MPAYNAAKTLSQTVRDIPRDIVDEVLLVDDASSDATVALARELGLTTFLHERNFGYGRNQKTCYREALQRGADIVVMVHPDYQYSPNLIVPMAGMIAYGDYDVVMGSRILGIGALKGGMPLYKYIANRFLTLHKTCCSISNSRNTTQAFALFAARFWNRCLWKKTQTISFSTTK